MVIGKNGASGPIATPLAPVAENSDTELARLPPLEATTVLATQLRRLHALILEVAAQALCPASEPRSLLINHLAKTSPVQVNFYPVWFDDRLQEKQIPVRLTSLTTSSPLSTNQ